MTEQTPPDSKKPKQPKAAVPAQSRRLSPDDFRNEVQAKGWTYKMLAERWDVTPNWVSKTARNAERSPYWDDAVHGLPLLMTPTKK